MSEPNPTPTLAQVIRTHIEANGLDVHTMIPATVESYDAAKQLVDATPSILKPVRGEDGAVKWEPYGTIYNCPVIFPGANGFRLTFPIAKGDTVALFFAETSLDVWQQNGGQVNPRDHRRFHTSDAVAVPGFKPDAAAWKGASASDATIGKDGGPQVVFRDSTIEAGGNVDDRPTDFVALAQKVLDQLNSMAQTFNTHTHMVETAGTAVKQSGTTVPPASSMSPSSVAASVLKAK